MADARLEYDWGHTSSLMALIANCNRDEKTPPYTPRFFNPLYPPAKPAKVGVSILKDVFIDGKC